MAFGVATSEVFFVSPHQLGKVTLNTPNLHPNIHLKHPPAQSHLVATFISNHFKEIIVHKLFWDPHANVLHVRTTMGQVGFFGGAPKDKRVRNNLKLWNKG